MEMKERREEEEDLQTASRKAAGEGEGGIKKRDGEVDRPSDQKAHVKREGEEAERSSLSSLSSSAAKTSSSSQEKSNTSREISQSDRREEKEKEEEEEGAKNPVTSKQEEARQEERKIEVDSSKKISSSSPSSHTENDGKTTRGPAENERRDLSAKDLGQAPNLLSNSSLSAGGSVRTSRRPSVSLGGDSTASSIDLFEAAGATGEGGGGEEEAWKAAKLRIENDVRKQPIERTRKEEKENKQFHKDLKERLSSSLQWERAGRMYLCV